MMLTVMYCKDINQLGGTADFEGTAHSSRDFNPVGNTGIQSINCYSRVVSQKSFHWLTLNKSMVVF